MEPRIELFETDDHYILLDGDYSLWCSRKNGQLEAKSGVDLLSSWNPICLGQVHGVIGKVRISAESEKLLLIRQVSLIGDLPGGHTVYGINKIAVLPLTTKETPELGIELCKKHHFGIKNSDRAVLSPDGHSPLAQPLGRPLQKTWNTIKTATAQVKVSTKKKVPRDRDRFEKRITDELIKMFTDTESFYFSPTGDLTNCTQRHCQQRSDLSQDTAPTPLWTRVDHRFFFNMHMLKEIIDQESPHRDHWIIPIIQGYVEIEYCHLNLDPGGTTMDFYGGRGKPDKPGAGPKAVGVALISRRSRYRAGTRYRRRGVDDSGRVANYVETEQIIEYEQHILSFVQVRGSVPVYWSQPGSKYRPPPRLDRGPQETKIAFQKHFEDELETYGNPMVVVNLVEKNGKEKIVGDEYFRQVLEYDSPKITYVAFDFHEYCRGMRFENVSVLILSIQDVIRDMMYCWTDKDGIICEQKGVFRVNCIDCLDRTNVVQKALATAVLDIQVSKLGLVPPEGVLPPNIRNTLQIMWANNGDSLSRQYAGTAALKGDFTRTGERKLAGMMKDGYNSANRYYVNAFRDSMRQAVISLMQGELVAEEIQLQQPDTFDFSALDIFHSTTYFAPNFDFPFANELQLIRAAIPLSRYYLNRFKDANRQAAIDVLLGNPISEEDLGVSPEKEADQDPNWSEHIKQLIEHCKKILVPESQFVMGGWALIDADPECGDPHQQDADSILILTRDSYYVAEYDDDTDRITRYQRVMLNDLEKIELGPEPSLFKSKYHCIRLNYQFQGQTGYYHMFRSTNIRFFNNMTIFIKSEEEAVESLKAICDTFLVALEVHDGHLVPFCQGKLERKRSKPQFHNGRGSNPFGSLYLDIPHFPGIPRNVSEGQLIALKTAGSKAISNVTSQIAKLNPMSLRNSLRHSHGSGDKESSGVTGGSSIASGAAIRAEFHVASSSDSDDETAVRLDVGENEDVVLESCGILATGSLSSSQPMGPLVEDHYGGSESLVAEVKGKEISTGIDQTMGPLVEDHYACPAQSKIEAEDDKSNQLALESLTNKVAEVAATSASKDKMNLQLNIPTASTDSAISADGGPGSRPKTPEIHISLDDNSGENVVEASHLSKKHCHSSDSIEKSQNIPSKLEAVGSASAAALLKTSHSDGAIREFTFGSPLTSPLTSPVTIRKDVVLAPFTKLAKGVQNLGVNIQKATSGRMQQPETAPHDDDETYEKMKAKRRSCKSRIIEL